ncbi:hypothetical protein FOVSG1_009562 [Fusarium oxysporum f. sp. vasinfectum]
MTKKHPSDTRRIQRNYTLTLPATGALHRIHTAYAWLRFAPLHIQWTEGAGLVEDISNCSNTIDDSVTVTVPKTDSRAFGCRAGEPAWLEVTMPDVQFR